MTDTVHESTALAVRRQWWLVAVVVVAAWCGTAIELPQACLLPIALGLCLVCALNDYHGLLLLAICLPVSPEINLGAIITPGVRTGIFGHESGQPVSISLYDLLILSLWCGLLFRQCLQGRLALRIDPSVRALMGFVLWGGASILVNLSTLRGGQATVCLLYLFKFFEVSSLYVLVLNILKDKTQIVTILRALLVGGGVQLCIGLLFLLCIDPHEPGANPLTPFFSTFVQDRINYFGFSLLTVALLSCFLVFRNPWVHAPWLRMGCAVAILLHLLMVALTFKRTLLVGLFCVGWYVFWVRRMLWVPILLGAVVLLTLYGGSADFRGKMAITLGQRSDIAFGTWSDPKLVEQATPLREWIGGEVQMDPSLAERLMKWYVTWSHMDMKTFVFGRGFFASQFYLGYHPHNMYLQLLFEVGLVGALLLLRVLYIVARQCRALARWPHVPWYAQFLGISTSAVLLAFAFIGTTDEIFYFFQLMTSFWLLVALVRSSYAHFSVMPRGFR
ncbi:MAG: hypothetical protein HY696_09640 [Deltaproteobacteria bacterium]|nr:hypothetical protein [Deltaproteobacteria bacterium]